MPSYTDTPAGETRKAKLERHKQQTAELLASKAAEAKRETEQWDDTRGAWANPELVMGAGVVSPPGLRRYKAPYQSLRMGRLSWANTSMRDTVKPAETLSAVPTWGWAVSPFGDDDTEVLAAAAEQGTSTVLVYSADGELTIRPVSEYRRKAREATQARRAATDAQLTQLEREARRQAQLDMLTDDRDVEARAAGIA